jgi:hypothetical protein
MAAAMILLEGKCGCKAASNRFQGGRGFDIMRIDIALRQVFAAWS